MANIYDMNAALNQPDIVGQYQKGQLFAQQRDQNANLLQQQQQSLQDQGNLRALAPQVIAGDPNAYAQAAAIDPKAAEGYQGAGDDMLRRLQGAISYLDQQTDPRAKQAVFQSSVRPFLSRLAAQNGHEVPMDVTQAQPGIDSMKARIAELAQPARADNKVIGNSLIGPNGEVIYKGEEKLPSGIQELQYLQQHPELASFQREQQAALHPRPTVSVTGGLGKPPSGYRWNDDNSALEPIPGGPADSSGTGQGLSAEAIDNSAWAYLGTGKLPAVGRGKEGVAQRTAVMNRAAEVAKDAGLSSAELQTVPGRNRALQSSLSNLQKQSDMMEKAEQGFANNAEIARQLSSEVDRTGSPVINKWVIGGKIALGDPKVAQLDVAINALATDYARIMSGATGAGGTPISTAEEARKFIRSELSHKQFGAVLDTIDKDIAGQQAAVHSQRGKIIGAMQLLHDDSSPEAAQQKAANGPQEGHVEGGYVFKGGDPADKSNWEKL